MKTARLATCIAAAAVLAGCSGSDSVMGRGMTDGQQGVVEETTLHDFPVDSPEYFTSLIGDRVFFEVDNSAVNAEAAMVLEQQAQWLNQNPGFTVTVEGHADEQGTREYNLALGARRASAVRDFLVGLGVAGNRVTTVTYGKERPVAVCSNESCWSMNRRAVTGLARAATG